VTTRPLRSRERRRTERAITSVGIIGGTGAFGRGLAVRFARAGLEVLLGSREAQRAQTVAEELRAAVGAGARILGGTNRDATAAELVVVALPLAALDLLPPLADALAGTVVVCVVNPTGFDGAGPYNAAVEEGSAAHAVAHRLPGARVTAAFHSVAAAELQRLDRPMDDDVLVVGDDPDAVAAVVDLADRIEGCRGVAAGPLRLAVGLESLTPVLITVGRRERRHVGLRLSRI
jgi:8-hydroxy-5-deazaflavin:NADPH oxidoreductase